MTARSAQRSLCGTALAACGLLGALALLASPARAQAQADDAQAAASAQLERALKDQANEQAKEQSKSEPQRSEGGRPQGKLKVLRLDEFTVEGRIQKPQAFFILQRSNLNFDDSDKKESFLPKIVKTCEKDPF